MKKKVIALTVDTALTNEELERTDNVQLELRRVELTDGSVVRVSIPARSPRRQGDAGASSLDPQGGGHGQGVAR